MTKPLAVEVDWLISPEDVDRFGRKAVLDRVGLGNGEVIVLFDETRGRYVVAIRPYDGADAQVVQITISYIGALKVALDEAMKK